MRAKLVPGGFCRRGQVVNLAGGITVRMFRTDLGSLSGTFSVVSNGHAAYSGAVPGQA